MKHKYAEMVKAKADNMELVFLVKSGGKWKKSTLAFPASENTNYFLCHPKHANETILWLNGGEVEFAYKHGDWEDFYFSASHDWGLDFWYMRDDFESSIKPKKEKRWIFIDTQFGFESTWCSNAYPSRELAIKRMKDWSDRGADTNRMQIVEIEIEVD